MVKKAEKYRNMSDEQLEEDLKKLQIEEMKARTKFGQAKMGKQKERGQYGSDIIKRLRRERARIATVLNEKRK